MNFDLKIYYAYILSSYTNQNMTSYNKKNNNILVDVIKEEQSSFNLKKPIEEIGYYDYNYGDSICLRHEVRPF